MQWIELFVLSLAILSVYYYATQCYDKNINRTKDTNIQLHEPSRTKLYKKEGGNKINE